jgi:hypothetical protein
MHLKYEFTCVLKATWQLHFVDSAWQLRKLAGCLSLMCLQVQLNVHEKTAATRENEKKMKIITAEAAESASNDLWRCFGRALQAENQVLLVAQVKSS